MENLQILIWHQIYFTALLLAPRHNAKHIPFLILTQKLLLMEDRTLFQSILEHAVLRALVTSSVCQQNHYTDLHLHTVK